MVQIGRQDNGFTNSLCSLSGLVLDPIHDYFRLYNTLPVFPPIQSLHNVCFPSSRSPFQLLGHLWRAGSFVSPLSTVSTSSISSPHSSAYSLSGHVVVNVSNPSTFFGARRPASLLLQSLELTFEGQSEVLTHEIGYSSLRICSVTKELVTEAVELVQEGDEDDSKCTRRNQQPNSLTLSRSMGACFQSFCSRMDPRNSCLRC